MSGETQRVKELVAVCEAPTCLRRLRWRGKGRRPRYCSSACRQAAYRDRAWRKAYGD